MKKTITALRFRLRRTLALVAAPLLLFASALEAQQPAKPRKELPAQITIAKVDFDRLFEFAKGEKVKAPGNRFLDGAPVVMNTSSGDMKLLRVKLNGFETAHLVVQVNGSWSTQVFILSDDHSASYKGSFSNGGVLLTKCDEDEIVSE